MTIQSPVVSEIEQALIGKAQHGDRSAFCELVGRHQQGVIAVVYRMCGCMALAEDAAQETFIKAWLKLPGYKPRSAFKNWLYRIATNITLDTLRHERPAWRIDDLSVVDSGAEPQTGVEAREQSQVVQQALLALPPASRAVLVLREFEGLSYKDIADTLDIPLGTVMSRLNYARTVLRRQLVGEEG